MLYYDQDVRRQVAVDRMDRLAEDYARSSSRRSRRRARRRLPLAGGMELVERAKRWAQRPQYEA